MSDSRERENQDLRDELAGPDTAPYATAQTGAGGQPARDADQPESPGRKDPAADGDEKVGFVGGAGGSPPGSVAPGLGEDWPDPLGGDDEERDLERRTR